MQTESQKGALIKYAMKGDGDPHGKSGLIIADIDKYPASYSTLSPVLAFEADGEFRRSNLERHLRPLFGRGTINLDVVGDVYIFRQGKITARYSPLKVLEYTDFNTGRGRNTFISAYSAAVGFLGRDITVTNDYFLSGYEENGGEWVFYFNIAENNIPVVIDSHYTQTLGLNHLIEVKVRNGSVERYRRLAVNFYENPSDIRYITNAYAYAYQTVNPLPDGISKIFTSVELCYFVDDRFLSANPLSLHWNFMRMFFAGDGSAETVPFSYPAY
jgi:hypothetical protein